MSTADEARAEAALSQQIKKFMVTHGCVPDVGWQGGYLVGYVDGASRKPEAAPSDTDLSALLAKWDDPERPAGWNAGDEHHLATLVIDALRSTSQPVQVEPETHRAVREFLESALAESDADERDPHGGSGWDVEVDARTVLRLLDSAPAQPVQVEVTEALVSRVADAIAKRSTWPSLHWPDVSSAQHRDVAEAFARAALAALGGGK